MATLISFTTEKLVRGGSVITESEKNCLRNRIRQITGERKAEVTFDDIPGKPGSCLNGAVILDSDIDDAGAIKIFEELDLAGYTFGNLTST